MAGDMQDLDIIELLRGYDDAITNNANDLQYETIINQLQQNKFTYQNGNQEHSHDPSSMRYSQSSFPNNTSPQINQVSNTRLTPKVALPIPNKFTSTAPAVPTPTHISSQPIIYEDYAPFDVATLESRIKSYELRTKGQIRAIRSLESQLNQTNRELEEKTKLLQLSNNRIRILESKERNMTLGQHNSIKSIQQQDNLTKTILNNEQLIITKFEEQIQFLENRLTEEYSRRMKSEERSRAFKEYYEKLKLENNSLDTQLSNINKLVSELQLKVGRYKKDNKDLTAELIAYRSDSGNKAILIEQQSDRLKKAEKTMREVNNIIGHYINIIKIIRIHL